jgi:hypothetical protein
MSGLEEILGKIGEFTLAPAPPPNPVLAFGSGNMPWSQCLHFLIQTSTYT